MRSGVWHRALHRPQQIWLRKAMFQVHLWVGLAVSLYVVLIAVSGSVLIFHKELEGIGQIKPERGNLSGSVTFDAAAAQRKLTASHPQGKLSFLYTPRADDPVYSAYLLERGETTLVRMDARSGKILSEEQSDRTVLGWIGRLHYFLLLNRSPGLLLNGIGAALLLLLTGTGLTLWWPGLKTWKRGVRVDFRKSWKRINFDTHNVVGFWTLGIVSFWAISGVYFAWPQQVTAAVNFFSPVSQTLQRIVVTPARNGKVADLAGVVATALQMNPGKQLAAIGPPRNASAQLTLYLTRPAETDLINSDFVYFDPSTGKYLGALHRGEKKTAGDWIIWAMHPLHFGTSWGLGIKVLYFLLGMSLPLMVVTGLFMYWNRYLSKKWSRLKRVSASANVAPERAGTSVARHEVSQAREVVSK